MICFSKFSAYYRDSRLWTITPNTVSSNSQGLHRHKHQFRILCSARRKKKKQKEEEKERKIKIRKQKIRYLLRHVLWIHSLTTRRQALFLLDSNKRHCFNFSTKWNTRWRVKTIVGIAWYHSFFHRLSRAGSVIQLHNMWLVTGINFREIYLGMKLETQLRRGVSLQLECFDWWERFIQL